MLCVVCQLLSCHPAAGYGGGVLCHVRKGWTTGGQQAETGRHRSFDVLTPPYPGTSARNVVEQSPSCRCAAPLPAPAHAQSRFRQFPLVVHPFPPTLNVYTKSASGAIFLLTYHGHCLQACCPHRMCTQNRPLGPFSGSHTPAIISRPADHIECVHEIGLWGVFLVHIVCEPDWLTDKVGCKKVQVIRSNENPCQVKAESATRLYVSPDRELFSAL